MLARLDVRSLSADVDFDTFKSSAEALLSDLRKNGACLLRLPSSDAEIVGRAVAEATAGFQNAFGTGGTRTRELARSGYRVVSEHRELFEFHEHGHLLPHPAGAAAQEVTSAITRGPR